MKQHKTYLNTTLMLLLSIGLVMSSCNKDDDSTDDAEPQPQQAQASTYPTPSDADGTLVAVKSNSVTDTPIGPITTVLGTAVAVFSDDGFASADWISAGTVSCNTNPLTLNANNSYVFTDISATNPMGIDFNSDVMWSVSGANGIATFDHNANNLGFPTTGAITSSDQVVKANGYTLTNASVSGADSVIFIIGGTASKTLAGNATSCTFTADELASVGTGSSIAQVTAYVMAPTDFGDTRIYFVNQTSQTKSVTVQ